jgi:hypothetical protein
LDLELWNVVELEFLTPILPRMGLVNGGLNRNRRAAAVFYV